MFGAVGPGRLFRGALMWCAVLSVAYVVLLTCLSGPVGAEPDVGDLADDKFSLPPYEFKGRKRVAARPLRIASWNLSDAVRAGGLRREKRKRAIWRNTFVPRQRAIRNDSHFDKRLEGVDIVLLQGVHSIREARRLFPARGWKLVVSRAILKGTGGRGPFARVMPDGFETTAIAVRYRLGVRVTGQEHLLSLEETDRAPGASADVPSDAGPDKKWKVSKLKDKGRVGASRRAATQGAAAETAAASEAVADPAAADDVAAQAGLAVRVFYNRRVIWFVSAALSSRCAGDASCEGRARLHRWIEDKRDFDFEVIVGGRVPRGVFERSADRRAGEGASEGPAARAGARGGSNNGDAGDAESGGPRSCDGQALQSVPPTAKGVSYLSGAGCIAMLELEK